MEPAVNGAKEEESMKRVLGAALLLAGFATVNPAPADDNFPLLRHLGDRLGVRKNQADAPCDFQTAQPPLAAPAGTPLTPGAPVIMNRPAGAYSLVSEPPATLPNHVTAERPAAPVAVVDATSAQSPEVGMIRINSKHLQFNYDVKNIGPSGIMGVEVWYTRDGQTWQKSPSGIQRENPYYVDVEEEGVYGFTFVARTGLGGGKEPPTTGDPPQIWVEVDVTRPVVFLTATQPGSGSRTLTVNWTATDKNLGRRPISLYFADEHTSQWLPIAVNLENSGSYAWQIPLSVPNSFKVRVDATDLAGNVGSAETPSPVQIDLNQPDVTGIRVSTADKAAQPRKE
jgi:hypothetical protein